MAAGTNLAAVAETALNSASACAQTALREEFNEAGLEVLQGRAVAGYRWYVSHGQAFESKASEIHGPIFRQIRDAMKNQGARNDLKKKRAQNDTGFRAWLSAKRIPHTTIYGWIREDEIRTGHRNKPKPKKPALDLTTSYETVRSSKPEPNPEPQAEQDHKPEPEAKPDPEPEQGLGTEPSGGKIRTKRLCYAETEIEEFERLENALRPHLGTNNAPDTVLAALRNLHNFFVPIPSPREELSNHGVIQ